MNYGKISKAHAYHHGVATPITNDHANVLLGDGTSFTPKRLEKANDAREKLREQLERKWKIGADD